MRVLHRTNLIEYGIICFAFILALVWLPGRPLGDQAYSRLATVHALTAHGTWYLDEPADRPALSFDTVDKVMVKGTVADGVTVGGRMISSKPPILPLAMTALYAAQRPIVGWDLADPDDVTPIARYLTISLMTSSYIITLIFFVKILRLYGIRPFVRVALLIALAFGTQLFAFSTIINNHVPAAAMLMVALYQGLGVASGKLNASPWRFIVFGVAGALVCTIDMPAGLVIAMVGLYLLKQYPRSTLAFTIPAAIVPLALHFAVMIIVTGSPLPVQVRKTAYLYEGSYWRHPVGIDALNEPKGTYLFHMTLGRCGLFSLYPVLLAGVAAALRATYSSRIRNRGAILLGLAAFGLLTAYYCLTTNNYGGESYGFRWYIPAMPLLLLMAAPLLNETRARWRWAVVIAMFAVSAYSAFEAARTDWQASQEWTCRILGPSV